MVILDGREGIEGFLVSAVDDDDGSPLDADLAYGSAGISECHIRSGHIGLHRQLAEDTEYGSAQDRELIVTARDATVDHSCFA